MSRKSKQSAHPTKIQTALARVRKARVSAIADRKVLRAEVKRLDSLTDRMQEKIDDLQEMIEVLEEEQQPLVERRTEIEDTLESEDHDDDE